MGSSSVGESGSGETRELRLTEAAFQFALVTLFKIFGLIEIDSLIPLQLLLPLINADI